MGSKYNSNANSGLDFQNTVNRPLQSNFGDRASAGVMGPNPADGMQDKQWYWNAQDQYGQGQGDAQTQQGAGAASADQYDQTANNYDQFAAGAGGQMEPGMQRQQQSVDQQQQGVNKQQGQADWMWNNPGFTDQEKTAMSTAAQTPIAGAYSSAQNDLKNSAARTGNAAAYGAQASDLARSKAQDMAMSGLNQQGMFAQQRIAGTQAANAAQGAATEAQGGVGQSQGNVNATRQGALGVQSSILNTGAGIRAGGINNRLGIAQSANQTAQTALESQKTQQQAGALGMMPTQMALQGYGTSTGALGANNNTSVNLAGQNPSMGKTMQGALGQALGNAPSMFKPISLGKSK